MQYQVLSLFVFGFLLTVFPRWMGQPALEWRHYVPVFIGIFGGYAVSVKALHFAPLPYINNTWNFLSWFDVRIGMVKAGVFGFTKSLARECANKGITVNAVAPGLVLLPDDVSEEERARLLRKLPHGPMGSPHDVARAVQYLLTEPFVTGVCLPIDGGQSLG